MFQDLLFTLQKMLSIMNIAVIACPTGLIIALHYMSERKKKLHRIDYDPIMRRKYDTEVQPSAGFATFMTIVGLGVAGLSFAYLAWPNETKRHAEAGWEFVKSVIGKS